LVQVRIIAEPYEALAADHVTRFEEWRPGRWRDSERSPCPLFDLGKLGIFDATHVGILPTGPG
jgi:hypothetical protein